MASMTLPQGKYSVQFRDAVERGWIDPAYRTDFMPVPAKPKVYVIGSLRNERIPVIANELRKVGFEVFDDWYAAGPEADDHWKAYEQQRGRTYKDALNGYSCGNAFNFDRRHIDAADIGVMVLPAGKSGHTELGYMAGKGKKTFVLIDGDTERWDLMYKFFTGVAYSVEELIEAFNAGSN